MQALRWRITKVETPEERYDNLIEYIKNDLFNNDTHFLDILVNNTSSINNIFR